MTKIVSKKEIKIDIGDPYLFGANIRHNGCNFALFSKNASSVSLLLFDDFEDSEPATIIELDKKIHKTGDVWHIFIYGIKHGQYYGYIVDGPYWPVNKGHRFNVNKLLVDPYSKAICGRYNWIDNASFGYDVGSKLKDLSYNKSKNYGIVSKSAVVDVSIFDWEGDKPLNIPMKNTIIYEMHVRAFTYHPSSKVNNPGTYLGVVEKIPYLKELGITTIELLPVQEFNDEENIKTNPVTGERLKQFWGYSTISFFPPDSWYATKKDGLAAVFEFKEMVKQLHKAGIEVIMDVVYNHSGEGNEFGPTVSFRGLDNSIYYMLDRGRYYKNYSGCGNTLNCNHPVVRQLIMDSLRYWVIDMHVDGFRFDLAAILGRDDKGNWVPNYSILSDISHDPILSNTKIIAEGWDAAGLFKVGGFPARWAEWNSKFRDDIRSFLKGDNAKTGDVAKRVSGSADLFHYGERTPYHSINFITAHDGFTLNDLVSYNDKHNEQNCENNMDGDNNNLSWNCGVEGETTDYKINMLRDRQMKNMFTLLLISMGTPMILSGDEMKFSKKGNNNTYCHDNELNWLDWGLIDNNREFFEFCKFMINFRKTHPVFQRDTFLTGFDSTGNKLPDISWHGIEVGKPDWGFDSHTIAFMLDGSRGETGGDFSDNNIYVAINSYWEDLDFQICEPGKKKMWYICVDTGSYPGFYRKNSEPRVETSVITVKSRSMVILIDK